MFWLKNVVYIRFKFTFWEIDFWRKRFSKIFTPKKSWPGQDPSARSFASTVESTTQKNNREAVLKHVSEVAGASKHYRNILRWFWGNRFSKIFRLRKFFRIGKIWPPLMIASTPRALWRAWGSQDRKIIVRSCESIFPRPWDA